MLDLLSEPACVSCGQQAEGDLCAECAAALRLPPKRLDVRGSILRSATSLGDYGGVVGALVRAAKFQQNPIALRLLLELVESHSQRLPHDVDQIVPVPTTIWRWMWRGAHLPEEMAHRLAARSAAPVHRALRRRWGPAQSGMAREAREENARLSFELLRPPQGRVLLVDDVVTSGASAQAAAAELLGAGARSVDVLVLASSGHPRALSRFSPRVGVS
jgi:predicted amidophosphoribosyltransferase